MHNPDPEFNSSSRKLFIEKLLIKTPKGKQTQIENWIVNGLESWAIQSENPEFTQSLKEILLGKRDIGNDPNKQFYSREEIQEVPYNASKLFPMRWEMYYQKRFNQFDSDSIPSLGLYWKDALEKIKENALIDSELSPETLVQELNLGALLERKIHQLSHGEMKRFLLGINLLKCPSILLLDNPLEGIDPENSDLLRKYFIRLVSMGLNLIFLLEKGKVPDFIQNILFLQEDLSEILPAHIWNSRILSQGTPINNPVNIQKPDFPILKNPEPKKILEMRQFTIRYGEVEALKELNWTIHEGDRWWVLGPNGSGKSTLLSVIMGDHPQAYQDNFQWMGNPRGSGESIWDIKKRIGFMSPEMLVYLPNDQNSFQMLASGLFDTLGLFKKLKPDEKEKVDNQAMIWKLESILDRKVHSLSIQNQRSLLLARAFIKNPEILILDEPFQGLGRDLSQTYKEILEESLSQTRQTLIFTSHNPLDIPSIITHKLELGKPVN